MKKAIVLFLFVGLCFSGIVFAEVFKIKPLPRETTIDSARDKSSGQALWQEEIKAGEYNYDGKPFALLSQKGSGIYGSDHNFKSWESSAYYKREGTTLVPYQTKLVYKNQNGAVIQTVEKTYDFKNRIASVKIDGKEKQLEAKSDLIDKELLGTALANYPFEEKRDYKFYLLTNEPKIYPMTIKFIGEENLQVGKQTLPCFKIQMIPDLGALNIFGAFVPKTYFWYLKAAPHEFLRYEGLESGLGTPYIIIEKVK
jgi:hypothetical protein